ncbi:MAG TPA: polysaccharide deacetylase family protein [Clostridia bacterium]
MRPNTDFIYVDGNPIETEYKVINNNIMVPYLFLKNLGISVDILSNNKLIVLMLVDKVLKIRVNDKYPSYCLNSSDVWMNELCNTIITEKYISLKFVSEMLNIKLIHNSVDSRIYMISNMPPGIFQQLICRGDSSKKKVALTFDDAPDNSATIKILDILRDKGVVATFFVTGEYAEIFPQVLERIFTEGHQIGNHGYYHAAMNALTTSQVIKEIKKTEKCIKSITGIKTSIFRPPYGFITYADFKSISDVDYKIIGWTIDTKDYLGLSKNEITNVIKRDISQGAIILQHSFEFKQGILDGTIEALPDIIDDLRTQGNELVTINELLK